MTFNTKPNAVPVHCCCDPSKRLGWVKLDRVPEPGRISFCTERASYTLMASSRSLLASAEPYRMPPTRFNPAHHIRTEIAWLTQGDDTFLAVKSNDYPIEEWRKVVGFIEDDRRLVHDAPVR